MNKLMQDVRLFHVTFGHPAAASPSMQTADYAKRRAGWIRSEADELEEAATLAEQADAYIDAIYFAVGGLVELGVDPQPIWDLVQAANMAKVWPDGSVRKTAEGKVIKPDGWRAPDEAIEMEIARQLENSR